MNDVLLLALAVNAVVLTAMALLASVRARSWTRRQRRGSRSLSVPDEQVSRQGAVTALSLQVLADGIRSVRHVYVRFHRRLVKAEAAVGRLAVLKQLQEELAKKLEAARVVAANARAAISYRMAVLGASVLLLAEVAVIAPVFMAIDPMISPGFAVLRAAGISVMLFLAGKALARVYLKVDHSVYSRLVLTVAAMLAIAAAAIALATIYERLPTWAYTAFLAAPALGSFFLAVHSHSPELRAARIANRRLWVRSFAVRRALRLAARAFARVSAAAGSLELRTMERIGAIPIAGLYAGDVDPAAVTEKAITSLPPLNASMAPGALFNVLGQVGTDALDRYLRLAARWAELCGQTQSVLEVLPRGKRRRLRQRTYEGNGHGEVG